MKNQAAVSKWSVFAGALAALVLCGSAYAQHAGGGGGGHGGGGGGHAVAGGGGHGGGYGGYHGGYGGGYHGGYYGGGYRGGYYGGYRGGYYGGYRGYYGWRGGYGYGWGCCGWGWGWGWGWPLALGVYVSTLPYYYSTIWYDGIPYYYADDTYYKWDPNASQYLTVAPPAGVVAQAPAGSAGGGGPPPGSMELMAYPKSGQSQEQQAKDKFECHQWAAAQSGFDPTLGSSSAPANKRSDYMRAQAACLEGRGYSVQ